LASAGSSLKRRTAASIPDMAASGTPWFTSRKKPTVSAAAFTAPTTSGRQPERSTTGTATPVARVDGTKESGGWWKMAGMAVAPASTRPLTPALVSSKDDASVL
jgi:hypothetical protein